MTATMAAKDTNQLTRTNANLIGTNINGHHPIRRQPFRPQPPALVNTIPATATATALQTTMGRAINIGFADYTHAHHAPQHAGDGGIMHERVHQRNEVATGPTRVATCVDIAVVVGDDDEANVDSNGNVFTRRDRVATTAAVAAAVGDVNFPVDTRTGVTTTGGITSMLNAVDVDVDDDESDSFGSMETLSDNVAVWVDGEKHWVAGVDANTTCADLIGALLNYQNAQQLQEKQYQQQQQQPQQHMFNVNGGKHNNTNNNMMGTTSISDGTANTAINQSTLIKTSTHTKENCDPLLAASGELTIGGCLPMALTVPANSGGGALPLCGNRLMHATEYVIVKQHRHCEEYLDGNAKVFDVMPLQEGPSRKECELLLRRLTAANSNNSNNCNGNGNGNNGTFTALPNTLHRANSPSLNLNTQVSSLLSTDKDSGMGSPVGSSRSARLRRRKYKSAATVSWLAQANTLHPRVSQRAVAAFSGLGNALTNAQANNGGGGKHIAVIDCGMGEDDDAAADALAGLGGGGDGGGEGVSANERLLKIILAQDETIHRQLALLREKERQISKIEEEKHRVRERELGKNYLLETYLNGLDEAHGEPDLEACTDVALADSPLNEFNDVRVADTGLVHYVDGVGVGGGATDDDDGRDDDADVEIYIDEPFQRTTGVTTKATKKDIGTSKVRDFNLDARHSKKLKGDFSGAGGGGGGGGVVTGGKIETNKQQDNEKDVEAQLVWLEKIYALNKQLQREEEMLLKLHAKIRKHQVKRAYQTKREVLQQIEKLDAELTLQCCDIRAVESKLHSSNEQLKQKLGVLERLSQEFLQTMETPAAAGDVADETVAVANRMPDVINSDERNLATMLPATEVARTRELHDAAVSLQAKQTTEQLAAQESCQLQQCVGTQEAVWQLQEESVDLPQTMHATAAQSNKIKELCELTQTNANTTTTHMQSTAENSIATTTTTTNALTMRHATTLVTKLTATSCTTSSSALSSAAQTTTATTTTTTALSDATTQAESAVFACNMSAVSPADEKQATALHLLQPQHLQQQHQQQQHHHQHHHQQQPQPQQKQLPAASEDDNNSHQCVAADDLLVDAVAAVGGVALPQSNYPISCINQAAIHATSKLPTHPHSVVAAVNLTTPEQAAMPTAATAILPAAYLASSATQSAGNITILQQQQQPVQLLPQRQYLNYMNGSCVSNDTANNNNSNTNNKNLLAPSHAAHTKTLQKQMFGPKSLNQRQPSAVPPPKTIHISAPAWTTPTAPTATPMHGGAHTGFSIPSSILAPLRPTTPTALSAAPVVPPVVDITQLGTLV